jgi:hypothetical protein
MSSFDCDHCGARCSAETTDCDHCWSRFCNNCDGNADVRWGRDVYCTKCVPVDGLRISISDSDVADWHWRNELSSKQQHEIRTRYEKSELDVPNDVCALCGEKAKGDSTFLDSAGFCDTCHERRRSRNKLAARRKQREEKEARKRRKAVAS